MVSLVSKFDAQNNVYGFGSLQKNKSMVSFVSKCYMRGITELKV